MFILWLVLMINAFNGKRIKFPSSCRSAEFLFHNRELQPALLRQDAIENHLHAIAGAEAASPVRSPIISCVFSRQV
jgi:hypothetical protein